MIDIDNGCIHHWLIEAHDFGHKKFLRGICKICSAEKNFPTYQENDDIKKTYSWRGTKASVEARRKKNESMKM